MKTLNQIAPGEFEVVAVCDVYDVRRAQAAKLAGGRAEQYLDYKQLLERKDVDAIIHGWQFSGITSFVNGAPMGVGFSTTTAVDISSTPDLSPRPVVTASPVLPEDHRIFNQFFNTGVFQLPAVGTAGNAAKNVFRGPGVNNWDASLAKSFRLSEKVQLRFRCETYNAFNHTQFSNVNTSAQFNATTGVQSNAAFGRITAARNPRTVQLAAKIWF